MTTMETLAEKLTTLFAEKWKTTRALTAMKPLLVILRLQDYVYTSIPIYIVLPKLDAMLLRASKMRIMLDEETVARRHLAPIPILAIEELVEGKLVTACSCPLLVIKDEIYVPYKPKNELEITFARLDPDTLRVDTGDVKMWGELFEPVIFHEHRARTEPFFPTYDYVVSFMGKRLYVSERRGPLKRIRSLQYRVKVDGLAYLVYGDPTGISGLLVNFSFGRGSATFITKVEIKPLNFITYYPVFLLPLEDNKTLLLRHMPPGWAAYAEHGYITHCRLLPPYTRSTTNPVLGPGSVLKLPVQQLANMFRPYLRKPFLRKP